MKPEWCPQWAWDEAVSCSGVGGGHERRGAIQTQREAIARALLDAHQRGKDENQAEIDRLNKVIARMQQTMSSQAEQWTRSMAEARREGMDEAAKVAEIFHEDDDRMDRKIKSDVANAIRAKAQEAKT